MDHTNKITLLIVDDEAEIRNGLRTVIPWESYSISLIGTASNGKEALEIMQKYHPDMVITDIKMPEMDGLELVNQANEEGLSSAFIILSGFDNFDYARTAIKYGVKDYLLKPVVIAELTDLVIRLTNDILSKRITIKTQLATLQSLHDVKTSIRQDQLVRELLHNELDASEMDNIIAEHSWPIRNKPSCAVLFKVLAPEDTFEEEDVEIIKNLSYLKKELESRLSGLNAIVYEHNEHMLLMIVNRPFTDNSGQDLSEFLHGYIEDMLKKTSFQIFAAIGENTESLMDISYSYQTAGQALAWYIYDNMDPVIHYSILNHPAPPVIKPDGSILDAILQNDIETATQQLDLYLEKLQYIPNPPPNYIYSMCSYLIINLRNALSQYMDTPLRSFSGDAYVTLQKLDSFHDIYQWMQDTICNFMNELQISRVQEVDPIIEKSIAYIQANIFKKIMAEDVSAHIGLSKSYFSTYFKNKTQLNFRDYVLDLKITYAQEQLKTLETSPKELAIMLGYEDYRSFTRAFKSRTGFSPSDYRKKYIPDSRE